MGDFFGGESHFSATPSISDLKTVMDLTIQSKILAKRNNQRSRGAVFKTMLVVDVAFIFFTLNQNKCEFKKPGSDCISFIFTLSITPPSHIFTKNEFGQ